MNTKNTPQAKHTPGPWQLGGFGRIYSPGLMPTVDGRLPTAYEIAKVPFDVAETRNALGVGFGESRANARLIAAAPELLEAARAAIEGLKAEAVRNGHARTQEADAAYTALSAAIAKAEGH